MAAVTGIENIIPAIQADMEKVKQALDAGGSIRLDGHTYYVDGSAGDDATGDGSYGKPYESIAECVTQHIGETGVICYIKHTESQDITFDHLDLTEWTFAAQLADGNLRSVGIGSLNINSIGDGCVFSGIRVIGDSDIGGSETMHLRFVECFFNNTVYLSQEDGTIEFDNCRFRNIVDCGVMATVSVFFDTCLFYKNASASIFTGGDVTLHSCLDAKLNLNSQSQPIKLNVYGGTVLRGLTINVGSRIDLFLNNGALLDGNNIDAGVITTSGTLSNLYYTLAAFSADTSHFDTESNRVPYPTLIPPAPAGQGTYTLQCTVDGSGTGRRESYNWV